MLLETSGDGIALRGEPARITRVYDLREFHPHSGLLGGDGIVVHGRKEDRVFEHSGCPRHVNSVRQYTLYELTAASALWNFPWPVEPLFKGRKPRLAEVAQMLSGSLNL